jgi:hypothetical protein
LHLITQVNKEPANGNLLLNYAFKSLIGCTLA